MNKENFEIHNLTIEQIQSEFDKVDTNDDIETIEFVEKHFDFLINYNTYDLVIIEDISEIFSIYYSCLGICNRWTDIILNRDRVLSFINKLKGKRDDYKELYFNIENVYADALIEKGNDYKRAIQVLEELHELTPKDEDIILKLRMTKYSSRSKTYKILIILGLTIILSLFLARIIIEIEQIKIISDIAWVLLIGILLIQYIDNYKSHKMPSS